MLPCEPLYGIGLTLAEEGSNREQRHYEVLDLQAHLLVVTRTIMNVTMLLRKRGIG